MKSRILRHIIGTRVNQIVSLMLQRYQNLPKDAKDVIKEEVKNVLSDKIEMMLESVIAHNQE